jgi:pyruvate,water dikinase
VVTDSGSSTGHLAAVARELRVPMLVDARAATNVLRPGMEVTVDAEENVIYEGIVNELVLYHLSARRPDAQFAEFQVLRRLLRNVTPLHLTDPNADNFRARSCSTYHDVVRFAHEMAVRELVDMPGLTTGDRRRFIRRLRISIPMDLEILDIGDGITPGVSGDEVEPNDVTSVPLIALLKGLIAPGVWRTDPVDMDMESLIASATRPSVLGMSGMSAVRPNLAVVAENYLNLHLLLGYHFNMVDCAMSDSVATNYLYFRFIGGATDIARRSRRARLIGAILQEYGFGVETKGDLVVGRLRSVDKKTLQSRLEMIGRLIGYTRQLDVVMRAEETVQKCVSEFMEHVKSVGE